MTQDAKEQRRRGLIWDWRHYAGQSDVHAWYAKRRKMRERRKGVVHTKQRMQR